jgi:hypothetical protein
LCFLVPHVARREVEVIKVVLQKERQEIWKQK